MKKSMNDLATRPSETLEKPPAGLEGLGRRKLIASAAAFLGLTVGIFWYQFHGIGAGAQVPRLGSLRWGYLLPILMLLPAETLLAGFRMWTICRVLQPGVSFATCLKAELANAGIAILTPSQTGGGPGQIYMLTRGGASLGTALTISLLSFTGTMAALLGTGLFSLLGTGIVKAGPLFAGAVVALTAVAGLIVSGFLVPNLFRAAISGGSRLFWQARGRRYALKDWRPPGKPSSASPEDRMGPLAIRLVEALYTYRDDLGRFLRHGKAVFALVCVMSLAFLLSRFVQAFLCVRFLGIEGSSLGKILENQMALSFLTYFAPTPGGAGIAEGASLSIMSGVVPAGYAPYYNLLWRTVTAYLAATTGLVVLASALIRDLKRAAFRRLVLAGGDGTVEEPARPAAE
jgi:uncharacterized protein (TIRG00374 family)